MSRSDRWTSERFELEVTEFVSAVVVGGNDGPAPSDDPPPKGRAPPSYRDLISMLN
jgi:hypothetical protein